jgi:hypothetical protein
MSESDLGYQPGGSALVPADPMALIAARFGADVQAGPFAIGGGAALALAAGDQQDTADPIMLMSSRAAAARQAQYETQAIRQVPLPMQSVPLTAGSGILNQPSQYGPPTGCYWSVRRITCWGFSAGTAVAYLDSISGEAVAPFAQAGVFTFGKGELLLNPQSWLIFQALSVTGTVQIAGRADQFPVPHLRYYLG